MAMGSFNFGARGIEQLKTSLNSILLVVARWRILPLVDNEVLIKAVNFCGFPTKKNTVGCQRLAISAIELYRVLKRFKLLDPARFKIEAAHSD